MIEETTPEFENEITDGIGGEITDGIESEAEVEAFDPEADLAELKSEFPELAGVESLTDVEGATRYGALRDLGLTPAEAYKATRVTPVRHNTRSHLSSAVPRMAASPRDCISREELRTMRGIFGDLSDADLNRLYKKVSAGQSY